MDGMNGSLSERIMRTNTGRKVWHQERIAFDITERLSQLMSEQGVTPRTLSHRLNRRVGWIERLIAGDVQPSIRELSDVFLALGRELHLADKPAGRKPTRERNPMP